MRITSRLLATLLLALSLGNCSKDSGTDPGPEPIDRSANLLAAGESSGDLLTNADFDELLIQIAYVEGFRPSDLALGDLREFLMLRTFKDNISFEFLPLPSPGQATLTLQEVASLENDNRTVYNDGRTLGIYIYFADAPSDTDDPGGNTFTLGAVYRNTSMVLHEVTIRELASKSAVISTAAAEAATLTHEFGHLFGLVDLGAPEVNAHEDPDAANHCLEDGCLMAASLEFTTGLAKAMEDRAAKNLTIVPDLGAECLRDLQAAGGR